MEKHAMAEVEEVEDQFPSEAEEQQQISLLQEQQRERNIIFADLEAYLEEFKAKKDEEGKPLVSFPKNFDKITSSMSRKDLYTNNASWSKCLLSSRFDEDLRLSNFEGGRYKSVFDEEEGTMKVERGLAEIAMMDKQIHMLNKRVHDISSSTSPNTPAASHRSKSRKSSRSNGVFLTRQADDSTATTPAQTPLGTPLATARTASDFEIESSDEEDAGNEANDTAEDEEAMRELLKRESDAAAATTTIPEEDEADEELHEETTADIAPSRSAQERDVFLQSLLTEEDLESLPAWQSISNYGYTSALRTQLEDIDAELQSRFGVVPTEPTSLSAAPAADDKPNYLLEQRAKRLRENYNSQLTSLLQSYKAPADLTGLINGECSSPNGGSVLSTPSIADIHPERRITSGDIAAAIAELQQHESAQHSASPEQLQRLLRQYHSDVTRLAALRGTSTEMPKSTDNSIDSNYLAAMATYEQELFDDDTDDTHDAIATTLPATTDPNEIFSRLQLLMASRHSSNNDNIPPPLARMTAAELKEAKNNEPVDDATTAVPVAPPATSNASTKAAANAIFRHHKSVVEGVELDLQAMHNRLERMLQRANSTNQTALDDIDSSSAEIDVVTEVMHDILDTTEMQVQQRAEEKKPIVTKRIVV